MDSSLTGERALVFATEALWLVPAIVVVALGRLTRLSWVTTTVPLVALLICGAFYRWTALGGSTDDTQFGEFALAVGAWATAAWLIIAGIRHLKASRQ